MTTALLPRGSRFGEIRLTGFLGSGGFSDVYAGIDASGRKLAVKVFRNRTSDPDTQRRRIAAEREALSAVDSRGVAKLVADDLAAKDPWIASEFVDGLTIRESIEADGHLSREEALGVTRRLAEVLRDLHAAGIAHRDLTPSNIVFGQDGPVVIDFGSARIDLDYDSSGSILLAATPGFTPPEAVEGKSVGQKADVYALAKIAEFMSGDEADTFPTEIRQSLSPDPSERPSAAAIADALSGFVQASDRFKARQPRKLPRRFSLTTVAAVSLGFAALTAGALYAGLIRQSPTPSLSEDERIIFSTDVTATDNLFHLGGPYFADAYIPQGLSAERVFISHTASNSISDPFDTTTLLDKIVFYSDGAETTRLELHANLASPNTLAALLEAPKNEMIGWEDAVGLKVQFMADLGLLEFDSLACPATMPDIVHYFEIRGIYFMGSTWDCFSENRIFFVAVQPETTTLFRLSGSFTETTKIDLVKLFASVIRTTDVALPSSIPLFAMVSPGDEGAIDGMNDVLSALGFSSESLRETRTSFPDLIQSRIAIRLDPGHTFIPSNFFGCFDGWALLSQRGELPAVTLGSFCPYDFNSTPIIENYFDEQIVVVLEVEWESKFPPILDLVPISGVEPPTEHYADQLFMEFTSIARTPVEIWTNSDGDEFETRDEDLWTNDILLSKWMTEALREVSPEERYNFATLGSVYLPIPADLVLNTTSSGDNNYAIRANPWNLNLTVFEPDVIREISARVSEFILPGTSEAGMSTVIKGRWECKTVRRGEKAIGAVAARMTLTANCVDPAVAMFPDAMDRIVNEHPHVEIIVYDPLGLTSFEPGSSSPELMRVDMSMSRVDDVEYVRFLIAALEAQFADLSVDEVRDALGRPAYGLGRFDSAGEPLAD